MTPFILRNPHAFSGHITCDWKDPDGTCCGYMHHDHCWPCSPTCTHDDAWTPGHPERVKERSEAFEKESAAVQIVRLVAEAGLPLRFVPRPDDDNRAAESEAYGRGAEAMRAACWEAVKAVLQRRGLDGANNLRHELQAAIKDATPQ